jgi:thiamine biosynthesis lipoprotein
MATTFEIIIADEDPDYARQVSHEAFNELDRLEKILSRYVENSDITRIKHLPSGQSLSVSPETLECLEISKQINKETEGVFDITVGHLMNCLLNKDKTPRQNIPPTDLDFARKRTGMQLIQLNKDKFTVQVKIDQLQIDLGGIGKGFAIDKLAVLLGEWSITTTMIHCYSTVLAIGCPQGVKGWPITMSHPRNPQKKLAKLFLKDQAFSGSGLQQGRHIIDPRIAQPVTSRYAAWASAPTAATADALSTSFLVMSPDDVEKYCAKHPDTLALIFIQAKESDQEKILPFGPWKNHQLLSNP